MFRGRLAGGVLAFVAIDAVAALDRAIAAQVPATALPGAVAGVGSFSHIVADMDRAVAFYRDVIGLTIAQPPNAFSGNPAIMNLGNTPGAQSHTRPAARSELGDGRAAARASAPMNEVTPWPA